MPQHTGVLTVTEVTVITTGTLRCRRNLLEPDAAPDTVTVPVRCFLLKCRSGYWLFDTGQTPPETAQSPDAPFQISVTETQTAGAQLRRLGVTLTGIVLSHAHRDHTAGLRDFPGVRTLIRRRELDTPAGIQLHRQYPQDWEIIDGEFDFSGDGSAVAVPTSGHTPGHQSLLVRNFDGVTLYAIDAAYTDKCIAAAAELQPYSGDGVTVIPGHPVLPEACLPV